MELVFAAVRISVPYILAALAGTCSERSGVVNIALEGLMLVGAFACVAGTLVTGSPLLGLAIGMGAGVAFSALHALATGVFRADHIVSGLALNFIAAGLTRLLLQRWYGSASNSPRIAGLEPLLAGTGAAAVVSHPLVWVTGGLVLGIWWLFSRSVLGLRMSAAGEHPEAVIAAGLPVRRLRASGVLLSGLLAGLAGVWLAFDQHQFTDGMSGGRGYIALAAMIFGRWRPIPATLGCLLFGAAEAVQISLQGGAGGLPVQLVQTLPYILTLLALCGATGRGRAPAGLGRHIP